MVAPAMIALTPADVKSRDSAPMAHATFQKLIIASLIVLIFPWFSLKAFAQGETTSAIVGQVSDASGAAVPGATVTIHNTETGLQRIATTDDSGRFNFPQLKPGTYTVRVEAQGFDPLQNDAVTSSLGQKQSVDFVLKIAQARENIEVSGEAVILSPENANTSTTLSAPALENLPNPGGDLTYPLQFAAGALINTAGSSNDFVGGTNGYGNVEFNGLPALSNGYVVDGLETNDPLTNLNSGLSTNLVLGLNSISEVTVNTLSYAVDQGRYGASQVDYVTKSGSNQFHGNLYELWNGSILNAADYFTNAVPGRQKPGATVNHFGGSLGGPIIHDKLFFFFDSEWVRIALPIVTPTVVPTPLFQAYVINKLSFGGTGPLTGTIYPAAPIQTVKFYQKMFNLYGNVSGTPTAVLGCPLGVGGDGCANTQSVSHSSDDHEQVQTLRIDYNIDEKNTTWFRLQADTGAQAAFTDPINSLFDSFSPQPLYSIAAGYTHVFSQNLVNYFNPAFSWYGSLFGPADFQKTLAAFPIVLQGTVANAFTTVGGLDNTWVQGRRASRLFINDNLAWNHGAHELRFGTNTRIFRLNDFDFGEGTVPTVTYNTLEQYIYGIAWTATKTFPTSANEPFNFLNLDLYAQDTWKLTKNLTWTFGIRDTLNSNPLNPHQQIARLKGSFNSISHDVDQPLNATIQTNLGNVFSSTPLAILQPRTAIAWQFEPKTVLRTGFGIFSDILPGTVADVVGFNPPYVKTFQGGLNGTVGGTAIAPGVPNSAVDATVAANQSFSSGFTQGQLSCASALASPATCLPPVAIAAVPDGKLHAPYFMEWSLGLEHELGTTGSLKAQYVGTRAVNQPFLTQGNGYQTVCPGCFAPFPYVNPADPQRTGVVDPRFGAVTQFSTGANSHYNGLQLTAMKRLGHGLMGQINYTWSRCMDTVSNGGFLQFSAGGILSPLPGELARNYGPCDYDIRHNLNAQYVYQLPLKIQNRSLGFALNGWQVSGTVFWHSGVPFSVLSTPYSANRNGIVNGSGPQFASVVPGVPLYDHKFIPGITLPGTVQWLNPDAFVSTVDPSAQPIVVNGQEQSVPSGSCHDSANPNDPNPDTPQNCQFGNLGRNALRGPQFFWSDFYLTKWFPITERVKLRFDAQFFNIFNHANFALPNNVFAGIPGKVCSDGTRCTQIGFGALTSTTSPPTGLLGVGLGGDSTPRMIAFQMRLEF
jgi:hypothetical protein